MIRSPRAKTIAIASVGSGSVSVGLASYDGTHLTLLDTERRTLSLEDRSAQHRAIALKQQLIEAAEVLIDRQQTLGTISPPDSLYCVIRAPVAKSTIVSTEASFDGGETVTASMLSALAREALSRAGNKENVLDAHVNQIALNGYQTVQPEGKRAHHIALTALISYSEPTERAAILEALRYAFPAHTPTIRSGTRAITEAISHLQPTFSDCLVLEVDEEGTMAIVIRHGSIEKESHISEGIRTMLARATKRSASDQGRQILSMMTRDEYSSGTRATLRAEFAATEPELAQVFGSLFSSLRASERLPNDLVLIAESEILGWLSHFFGRIDFTFFTQNMRPFTVTALPQHGPAMQESDRDIFLTLPLINKELRGE